MKSWNAEMVSAPSALAVIAARPPAPARAEVGETHAVRAHPQHGDERRRPGEAERPRVVVHVPDRVELAEAEHRHRDAEEQQEASEAAHPAIIDAPRGSGGPRTSSTVDGPGPRVRGVRTRTGHPGNGSVGGARRTERGASGGDDEGDRARWGIGNAARADDERGRQAAPARLRQADDLLPAVHADGGGRPRDPRDQHAGGPAPLRAPARRRRAVGVPLRVRGAGRSPRDSPRRS